jgi:hypothetical protein
MAINQTALFAIFPFLFFGMWLLVTTLLWWWSGWGALQEKFPDQDQAPLKRMRFQSGMLGKGAQWNPWGNVNYGNCLLLDICPSGLRVAIWRIFGLFSKPFFIPWQRITVEQRRILFMRYYRLSFGDPNLSALTIRRRTFSRIEQLGFLHAP